MATATPTSETISYERVATLTTHMVAGDVFDNVFGSNQTLKTLNEFARPMAWASGNDTIQIPLTLSNPGKAISYSGHENLNNTPDKPWTAGLAQASEYGRACSVSQRDIDDVAGSPAAMEGLMSRLLEVCLGDVLDRQNKDLWRDGTTKSTDYPGFAAAVASDPSADTYLSVASTSNTTWQNATTDNGNSSADIILDLRNTKTNATFGSRTKPTIFLTGRTERDALEGKLTATWRVDPIVVAGGGTGSGQIEELQFGDARVIVDENRVAYGGGTNNVVVMLAPSTWRKAYKPSNFGSPLAGAENWRMDDFQRVRGQTVFEAVLRWYGVYFTVERRANGVVYGLAAS